MLRFRCPHCSVKLTAREDRAGKKVICPRCKGKMTIPYPPKPDPVVPETQSDIQLIDPPTPLDGAMLELADKHQPREDAVDERQREEELLSAILPTSPPEHTGERKLPWPVDILLYPLNGPGLSYLGLVVGVPLVMDLIGALSILLTMALGLPFFLARCLIGLYSIWYLAECVRDSAQGGTRAPEAIADAPGLGDLFSRLLYLLAVYCVFVVPAIAYHSYTHEKDVVFWSLVVWAIAFFPMGLLAMAMFDASCALNPLLLLGSIFRTLLQYVGLLVVFALFALLAGILLRSTFNESSPIWLPIVDAVLGYYAALIVAHILGRFYWRNRERLDWGI